MKKDLLKEQPIHGCIQCSSAMLTPMGTIHCVSTFGKNTGFDIHHSIPKWCPLPDAKREGIYIHTVKELIEELSMYKPDQEVFVLFDGERKPYKIEESADEKRIYIFT